MCTLELSIHPKDYADFVQWAAASPVAAFRLLVAIGHSTPTTTADVHAMNLGIRHNVLHKRISQIC